MKNFSVETFKTFLNNDNGGAVKIVALTDKNNKSSELKGFFEALWRDKTTFSYYYLIPSVTASHHVAFMEADPAESEQELAEIAANVATYADANRGANVRYIIIVEASIYGYLDVGKADIAVKNTDVGFADVATDGFNEDNFATIDAEEFAALKTAAQRARDYGFDLTNVAQTLDELGAQFDVKSASRKLTEVVAKINAICDDLSAIDDARGKMSSEFARDALASQIDALQDELKRLDDDFRYWSGLLKLELSKVIDA